MNVLSCKFPVSLLRKTFTLFNYVLYENIIGKEKKTIKERVALPMTLCIQK